MAPFRQAVCFVKDPATDLTLPYCLFDSAVAQLFGGDIEQGDIPHADLFKNCASLWQRQQPRDGGNPFDTGLEFQVVHLIFHQCLQGGDHDRECATALVANQCRELVAERLAAAGREYAEQCHTSHGFLDQGLLQGRPIRQVAEVVELEDTLQMAACVVVLLTIAAVGMTTVTLANCVNDLCCLGEAAPNPGR